ncbi:putative FAD-dependent monooxygenase [Nostocoides japonicum T1-X7]|uniref:Putative FAD-dependent monooxygenase n=1 Tax=Nostocoides japonicum T1-X7 TaxID=1194083 RepID=A0A077LZT7_9MICO|nr:FAD-dependent monooxygenase [Tetrasphaera japonica]CCH77490.1 putative FAD-dependent monooxygenase [Tetrasphaera japonica T1-X7]
MIDVIIAGAGPTGVWLASELRLQGVDVLVVEKAERPTPVVRALGINARTVEILDMRGLWDAFTEFAQPHPLTGYVAGIMKPPPADLDTTYPHVYAIHQTVTERLLREHAAQSGVEVRYCVGVVGLTQTHDRVRARLADGTELEARFLVGCDGGRSTVRKAIGVPFDGEPSTSEFLLGEMELTDPWERIVEVMSEVRQRVHAFGAVPLGDSMYRVVVPASGVADREAAVSLEEVRSQLVAFADTDFGARSPRWLSRFGDATRLAQTYRVGRVLLAGDAAHIHPPFGGQGLNLGLHDATNLGWKLAAEVAGRAPAGLLDSYEAERRPVALDVLGTTRAFGEILSIGPGPKAVQHLVEQLMEFEEVNRFLVEKVTAIGVRYDLGDDDPRVGRHQRDIPVGTGRLYELLRGGRGLLLDPTGRLTIDGWQDRVDRAFIDDAPAGPATLIRPDGHVAWRGDDEDGLRAALRRWFGEADPEPAVVAMPGAAR